MYTITKADPSNLEYVGRSVGNKQEILSSVDKTPFVCFTQGEVGFVYGYWAPKTKYCPSEGIDFEPLNYFQDEVGFTSMYYLSPVSGKWHEL